MKFATKVIKSGIEPDPTTGAIITPIYQTSTYVQSSPGVHQGYEYARTHNPTREALEKNLAAIENGTDAVCFASGLAATDAIMKLFGTGDEIVSTNDLYGGTYRAFNRVYANFGMKFHYTGMQDVAKIEALINDNTKLIWVETPTNPMLNIIDIKAVSDLAKAKGVLLCVDNTFASPYLQNPLDLGADLVVHSATKYLGGHSDCILGAVVTKNPELGERLRFLQNATGAVPGPQDCFLITRGIRTLHLRVQQSCENATQIADFLKAHDKVANTYYPGFETHPNHEVAKQQMRHFGGMVSFNLKKDSLEDGRRLLENTHIFHLAESLGGVESLIGHPPSMTHGSIPREERYKVGMTDSLIRLSVGIEHADDLIEDLDKALSMV
ncbi:MAG: PLP-dependent aspartate aminotransferase family protein [Bacteroidota bacterium]